MATICMLYQKYRPLVHQRFLNQERSLFSARDCWPARFSGRDRSRFNAEEISRLEAGLRVRLEALKTKKPPNPEVFLSAERETRLELATPTLTGLGSTS
jgi:hypothetical protein